MRRIADLVSVLILVGAVSSTAEVFTCGDYDGDGKCDLFWRHAVTGDNAVWMMNGSAAPLGVTMPPVYDALWKPIRQ